MVSILLPLLSLHFLYNVVMRVLVLLFILFLPIQLVVAQEDGSTFQVYFDFTDYDAPSVPANLTAVPISSTSVDLRWDISTDNFTVTGYVLYRDSQAIATTTQTSYLDTMLMPSTAYTYSVQAFDQSGNYSATSTPVTVTTLSSGGSTRTSPTLDDEVSVEVGYTSADISVATNRPARIEIRWGRTTQYELGSISNNQLNDRYQTRLVDLEPGTTYYYQIVGYSPRGEESILESGEFTTLSNPTTLAVPNVINFTGERIDDSVRLRWRVPDLDSVAYVRIVRNYFDYPRTITDGAVVYQGGGNTYFDEGVLSQYSPVYYTAFVVNKDGDVSSGAVVRVSASDEEGAGYAGEEGMVIVDPSATTDKEVSPEDVNATRIPALDEILLLQEGRTKSFFNTPLWLKEGKEFIISIPQEAVSNRLKTILFSFTNPTDVREKYSYILRLNAEGTAYEASIPGLDVAGTSWFALEIYDYEAKTVSTYRKEVLFESTVSYFSLESLLEVILRYWLPLAIIILMGTILLRYLVWREDD